MSRCSICPNTKRCVPGDGPLDARVFCIGEAPGQTEDNTGIPFCGMAGKEFNDNYLGLAGLRRDEVYVTNTVKCRPDMNRKPTPREVAGCSQHFLPNELAEVQPEVVILMGSTPCSLLGGDTRLDLETEHGIPRWGKLFNWEGWIVPVYHPAAGLHDTALMTPQLEDWEALRPWLEHGRWVWAVDVLEGKRDYALVQSQSDIDSSMPFRRVVGIGFDTETHAGTPYSFQYSLEDGSARMVMLKDEHWVRESVAFLNSIQSGHSYTKHSYGGIVKTVRQGSEVDWVAMHNAPADLAIADLIGLRVVNLRDTMQEAYHFGNLRQGLKPLARRLLGRLRSSWEETVTPYSKAVLNNWLCDAFIHAENHWQEVRQTFHKRTKAPNKPKVVKSVAERLLVELAGYMVNNPEYKIWDKLQERMPSKDLARLVEAVGEVPKRGIAHCPIEVQVEYGCSDPDDTRRLAILFDKMRSEFIEGLNVQEEDVDA